MGPDGAHGHRADRQAGSCSLLGFAISSTEQRGKKVFLYELHVRQGQRGGGIGTALMEMAERTARGANRTMELNVHKDNEAALGYYEQVRVCALRRGERWGRSCRAPEAVAHSCVCSDAMCI